MRRKKKKKLQHTLPALQQLRQPPLLKLVKVKLVSCGILHHLSEGGFHDDLGELLAALVLVCGGENGDDLSAAIDLKIHSMW